MLLRALPFVLSTVTCVLALGATTSGCGRQGEGERCNPDNNDDDCEAGLVCMKDVNVVGTERVDICCPPSGSTNPSCIPGGLSSGAGTGGTGGAGGTGNGGGGNGGTGDGGGGNGGKGGDGGGGAGGTG